MANIDIFNITSALNNIKTLKQLQREHNILNLITITKHLYDFTKEQSHRNTIALSELVTEGFDEEQIWQQLELQNKSEIVHFASKITKVLNGNKKLMIPLSSMKPETIHVENKYVDQENKDMSDDKEAKDENIKVKNILKKRKYDTIKQKKSSIVDDKFFKLQEMDEYLIKEERKEKEGDNVESDEESVDLFNDFSEEEDEDIQVKYLKYTDFFDSPPNEDDKFEENKNLEYNDDIKNSGEKGSINENEETDENDEENEEQSNFYDKRVKFNLINDSDETDSLENKEQYKEDKEEDTEPKSSLEARQERLQMRIKELEGEAIREKPWQMKGEVSGLNRPQNSLLEEYVEFDATMRPPPVITEETTIKLEDIIKQRIKDKAFDDVEKKFKPVETPLDYKKKLTMNQEKSQESLSQIYENEYLKQQLPLKNNEKEMLTPELHKMKRTIRCLISKLDALCNYHYTPKRVKPEIKIISNATAIDMEEVAPVATSDATLLAPEEVKAKSHGDSIDKSEKTKTDKKRNRRRKKLRQRAKQQITKEKEKLNTLKTGITKKYNKDKTLLLKKLTKDRNIKKFQDETNHKIAKSSTEFFTQLQDQVKNQVKVKANSVFKKNDKDAVSARKF